jgi:hypothetical protein
MFALDFTCFTQAYSLSQRAILYSEGMMWLSNSVVHA